MLTRLGGLLLIATMATGCGLVPSDPGPRALGVSIAGKTLVAWLPDCDGEQWRGARVATVDVASAGPAIEGDTLWSADIVRGSRPQTLALDDANPNLTKVMGGYSGESRLYIAVTGLVEYSADVQVANLSADRVLFRGASVSPDEFANLSKNECRRS